MILRKIRGSSTAYAWLTAWANTSSHSERIGRTSRVARSPAAAGAVVPVAAVGSTGPVTSIASGRSTRASCRMLAQPDGPSRPADRAPRVFSAALAVFVPSTAGGGVEHDGSGPSSRAEGSPSSTDRGQTHPVGAAMPRGASCRLYHHPPWYQAPNGREGGDTTTHAGIRHDGRSAEAAARPGGAGPGHGTRRLPEGCRLVCRDRDRGTTRTCRGSGRPPTGRPACGTRPTRPASPRRSG